jgi:hypothetical protein
MTLVRRSSDFDTAGTPLASHVGGMRLGMLTATWPLARLDIFQQGLRLHGSNRMFRAITPVWEASFREIRDVQAVGKVQPLTTGIRFRLDSRNESAIFWSAHRPEVLADLAGVGLTVNGDPVRLNTLNPGASATRRPLTECRDTAPDRRFRGHSSGLLPVERTAGVPDTADANKDIPMGNPTSDNIIGLGVELLIALRVVLPMMASARPRSQGHQAKNSGPRPNVATSQQWEGGGSRA